MKEIKNGTEVPTDDKNDEKTGENNEKTEEVWQKKLLKIVKKHWWRSLKLQLDS